MKHIVDFFAEAELQLDIKMFKAVNFTNVTLRVLNGEGMVAQVYFPKSEVPPFEMKSINTIHDYSEMEVRSKIEKFLTELFYSEEEGEDRPIIHTQKQVISLPILDIDLFARVSITELLENV